MTTLTRKLATIRTFSLIVWWHSLVERAIAHVIGWAFSMPAVQAALVDQVECRTPIGVALNSHIEESIRDIDVGDLRGFDQAVDVCLDEFARNFEIDADNIKNLKEEVGSIVDECEIRATNVAGLDDEIDERLDRMADEVEDHLARLIAQRLSY